MVKTITIQTKIWNKLSLLKLKKEFKSHSDTIEYLLKETKKNAKQS